MGKIWGTVFLSLLEELLIAGHRIHRYVRLADFQNNRF